VGLGLFCSAASLPWSPGTCSPTVFRSAICDFLSINGWFLSIRGALRSSLALALTIAIEGITVSVPMSLYDASWKGHLAVARLLIDKDADVDKQSQRCHTAAYCFV
jgi:hypothetical protein